MNMGSLSTSQTLEETKLNYGNPTLITKIRKKDKLNNTISLIS